MAYDLQKPPELSDAHVDSWSHVNSDLPVTHSHALKISRFRQILDQFETSMFIQDSFSVNVSGIRTNWELRIYPNGYDDENSGYLGIFVKHKEGNSHRYLIKSVIQLLDSSGSKKVPVDLPGKVLSSKQMHGTKKYIERESLLQNTELYSDDSITFLLEAEICQPGSKTSVAHSSNLEEENGDFERSQSSIISRMEMDFIEMLNSGHLSDLIVKCEDQVFSCHKNILAARSQVFSAMFQHDMIEQRKNEVEIVDMSAPVVKQMLEYIYCGKFDDNFNTEALLAASEKYDLKELKTACEKSLSRKINLTNCIDLVILADTHRANNLKSSTLSFIVANTNKIVSLPDWENQLSLYPHIMAFIIKSLAKQNRSCSSKEPPCKRKKKLTSFREALELASGSSESEDF